MAHDHDVVAVVELNPVMATPLQAAAEAAGRYRYQVARPSFGSEGLALYSRYPIVSPDAVPSAAGSRSRLTSTSTASRSGSSSCTRSRPSSTEVDHFQVPGSDHRGFVVDVAVNP